MIESTIALSYEDMRAFVRNARAGLPDHVRVISIIDPEETPIFANETDRVLTFAFHDVEPKQLHGLVDSVNRYILFSESDAERVVAAIRRWHEEPDTLRLVVNCMAGISRSAAVCEFARRVCEIETDRFEHDNPVRYPNGHVLRLLVREFQGIRDES